MEDYRERPAAELSQWGQPDRERIDRLFAKEYQDFHRKVVVLDDDPTGVQTVHGVSVYTDWSAESIREGLEEENQEFFILTNSRSLSKEDTVKVHRELATRLSGEAERLRKEVLVISRGDSTLRGHFLLEPETLRETLEEETGKKMDGWILCPFFKEGGRYTIDSVHYVKEGERLVPAAQTEFAEDGTFGFGHSHLGEYLEEKSGGRIRREDCVSVTLKQLRGLELESITQTLCRAGGFLPILVDAIDETDVKVFSIALMRAIKEGKKFLIRSAAAFPKVMGNIGSRPLLSRAELIDEDSEIGGLVVVGSHVRKTTMQLEQLKTCSVPPEFVEFHVDTVMKAGGLQKEAERVREKAQDIMRKGRTAVIYTSRNVLMPKEVSREELLRISVEISAELTGIVARLEVKPRYLIAKGGITSSDVGTKGLRVRRAQVLGQVRPGIPVWKTGAESTFPGMSYMIFPGNVGEEDTLKQIVEMLEDR